MSPSIGWDWLPAVPDRDTGIWQKVWLSASGPVVLKDPAVTTDLKLPGLESAAITVTTTLQNMSDKPQESLLKGFIDDIGISPSHIPAKGWAVAITPYFHIKNKADCDFLPPWPSLDVNGLSRQRGYPVLCIFADGRPH